MSRSRTDYKATASAAPYKFKNLIMLVQHSSSCSEFAEQTTVAGGRGRESAKGRNMEQ